MNDGSSIQLPIFTWPAASCTCTAVESCTCRAAAGESDAICAEIAASFLAHGESVYRYLRHRGCSPTDADDVTQETFLRLLRLRLEGRRLHDVHVLPWVMTVARRLAIDRLRRLRVEYRLFTGLPRDLEETLPDVGQTCEEELREQQRRARLSQALEALSEQERECLHLRSEGLSLDAIGRVVGLSLWGARRSVLRAIDRVQRHLDASE